MMIQTLGRVRALVSSERTMLIMLLTGLTSSVRAGCR